MVSCKDLRYRKYFTAQPVIRPQLQPAEGGAKSCSRMICSRFGHISTAATHINLDFAKSPPEKCIIESSEYALSVASMLIGANFRYQPDYNFKRQSTANRENVKNFKQAETRP